MDLPATVIDEVEHRLGVHLDRAAAATGAWAESAGYRTDRGTWVRVASRPAGRIQPQSWVGAEAASVIPDVPMPGWVASATWRDPDGTTVWRAEEMELVDEPVIAASGTVLTTDPDLLGSWWAQLHHALAELAAFPTLRVAGRQELITRRISGVLGDEVAHLDTTVTEWATSHGDLHWGNLTAPRLVILDWADWGLAPRGNDAACLWATALAVPTVADEVLKRFHDDLTSRSGRIARLWVACNILRIAPRRADAHHLITPARAAVDELLTDLA